MSEEITHFDKPHHELDEFATARFTPGDREVELQPSSAKLCLVLVSRTSGYGNTPYREEHWHLSSDYVKALIVALEQEIFE